jgi:hypothetical protein
MQGYVGERYYNCRIDDLLIGELAVKVNHIYSWQMDY